MKIVFVYLFILSSLFANCPDSISTQFSVISMKNNYTNEDGILSDVLDSIVEHLKDNQKKEESNYKIDYDMKNLHVDSLLELKEIENIIVKTNSLIFKQR